MFDVDKIHNFTDSGVTALCPHCGVDSVISILRVKQIEDLEFRKEMHEMWFSDKCANSSKLQHINLNDLARSIAPYLEQALYNALLEAAKTCIQCANWDALLDKCTLYNLIPKPIIIANGCDSYREKVDDYGKRTNNIK